MTEHTFQAEVGRVLSLVINSLYSNKEIFLRELISNASDALDKLKLAALEQHALLDEDPVLEIELAADSQARTLTVSDSGIGMTRDELVSLIGTIAKSGTRELVEQLKAGASSEAAASLIGQFGVGFYSAFMVADRVAIVTRKAGSDTAMRWESSGDGTFTVSEASRFRPGRLLQRAGAPFAGQEALGLRGPPDQAEGGEGRRPGVDDHQLDEADLDADGLRGERRELR
jgi:molecular chaperone HtpG